MQNPNETILIFYCFMGHGVVNGGRTMILTNEFDPITKFYKTICSESDIRAIARRFSNSYQLAVFDCSRLILNRQLHSGHYSKQEMALISKRDLRGSFASELCCALQTKSSSRDQIIHEALQHDQRMFRR